MRRNWKPGKNWRKRQSKIINRFMFVEACFLAWFVHTSTGIAMSAIGRWKFPETATTPKKFVTIDFMVLIGIGSQETIDYRYRSDRLVAERAVRDSSPEFRTK